MKVASIFTGCGGLDLGLEQVRARDATARVGGGPCVRRGGGVGEVPAIAVTIAPATPPATTKNRPATRSSCSASATPARSRCCASASRARCSSRTCARCRPCRRCVCRAWLGEGSVCAVGRRAPPRVCLARSPPALPTNAHSHTRTQQHTRTPLITAPTRARAPTRASSSSKRRTPRCWPPASRASTSAAPACARASTARCAAQRAALFGG